MSGSGIFTGQRAKKAHLLQQTGGVAAEVADLRRDIAAEFLHNAALAVEEFTDPPAAVTDEILAAVPSSTAVQTFLAADLDSTGPFSPPRNVTITTSADADILADDAVITGTDINGNVITDTITLTAGGGVTDAGTVAFATVTQVVLPAGDGAAATLEVGFGDVIGLAKPLVSRAGVEAVLAEIIPSTGILAADAVTGAFVDAATVGPNGTYEPAAAPDGSNDYAVYYEYDASQNR